MDGPIADPFGLAGTLLEGRFAVEQVVAKGGFGVVYRAQHMTLRRTVAVKVLFVPSELAPHKKQVFLEGFTQEAQTIAALDHPAIVRVLDFGVSQMPSGRTAPWMVLEWVDGVTLDRYLQQQGRRPMSPADALDLLRPIFQALAFAHDQQIAHRDIKPSNIMLLSGRVGVAGASRTGAVHAKLLDFGIAKVMSPDESVGSGETHTHAAFLTYSLPYAAPEQKVAMKTGPWTDVHALGLILAELLTGSQPYPGVDRLEIEHRITAPTRPTPAMFGVDVGTWEPVLACALALRSPDRFQHAGQFLDALMASFPARAHAVPLTTLPMEEPPKFAATTPLPVGAQTMTVPPIDHTVAPSERPSSPRKTAAVVGVFALLLAVVVTSVRVIASSARSTAAQPLPVAPSVAPVAEAPARAAPPTPAPVAAPVPTTIATTTPVVATPSPAVVAATPAVPSRHPTTTRRPGRTPRRPSGVVPD